MNDHHLHHHHHHHSSSSREFCYYHPKKALVGVCPFCLNEKLLVVAAKQDRRNHHQHNHQEDAPQQPSHSRKPSNVGLPKIFAFGSLLNRLELRHSRRGTFEEGGCFDTQSTSASLEDSFISIKFEDNGVALWDKRNVSKASQGQASKQWDATNIATAATTKSKGPYKEDTRKSCSNKSVVEHAKTPRGSLRWRKRIGHFLQLVRWKRSNKPHGGSSHVDGLGGVKVRNNGWMRTLTRRRTHKE